MYMSNEVHEVVERRSLFCGIKQKHYVQEVDLNYFSLMSDLILFEYVPRKWKNYIRRHTTSDYGNCFTAM